MPHPYTLAGVADLPTPALVFYPALIRQNVARTIEMAGGPARLRPHVKTHKTREIVALLAAAGVTRHKTATIAEAELAATAGAADVLVAYPLVGPNPARLARLATLYPGVHFAALVDCTAGAEALSTAATAAGVRLGFYVDLDVGMGRTGTAPGPAARDLYVRAARLPGLTPDGLHAYDGHHRHPDGADRAAAVADALAPVLALRAELERAGLPVPAVVAGGTPTFPAFSAMRNVPGLECSPGTFVLHDHGYGTRFPDYPGLTAAAVVLTRVVSKPGRDRVTFDIGSKAVAADPPLSSRVHLLDAPDHTAVMHSEEHYVIETGDSGRYVVGEVVYAIPGHVCPTVALHEEALVADGGRVVGAWRIEARRRTLTV